MHEMDGRTYIHRSPDKFDLINLMFAELFIAFPYSQVLVENYLYTVEAFEDYLNHLSDNGILFISKPLTLEEGQARQMLRVTTTAHEALKKVGIKDPGRHILLLHQTCKLWYEGGHLLVKKTPFTQEEVAKVREFTIDPLSIVLDPFSEPPAADDPFTEFMAANDKNDFYEAYPLNVRPTTDDKPFFATFEKNFLVDRALFGVFFLAFLVFNLLPLAVVLRRGKKMKTSGYRHAVLLFALLGMAYMISQAVMVQKLNIFLGSPTYSLAVVIGSFLLIGAAGSAVSEKLSDATVTTVTFLIPAVMAAVFFLMPVIVERFFGASLGVRLSVSAMAVVPLALIMAVPFPRALEWAKLRLGGDRESGLMYAVDSAFAVLGVSGCALLSTMIGFNMVFMIALLLYVFAAVTFAAWRKKTA
jgi:hypothetical protein